MEDDDVRRLHFVWRHRDVEHPTLDPTGQTRTRQQLLGDPVVCVHQLDADRAGGAATEQLDLDLTHTAADLQDGGTVEAPSDRVVDHPRGVVIESPPEVRRRARPGIPASEDAVAPARIATPGHHASVPCSRLGSCSSPYRCSRRTGTMEGATRQLWPARSLLRAESLQLTVSD